MIYENNDLSVKTAIAKGVHDSIHTSVKYGSIIIVASITAYILLSKEQKNKLIKKVLG